MISYNRKGLHVREIDGDYYHKHVIFIKSSRPCAVFTVVFLLMIKACCILLVGQDIFQYQECTLYYTERLVCYSKARYFLFEKADYS